MKLKPFRDIWLAHSRADRERWVKQIGTSYGYLQKLAGDGFATPSLAFAMRMKKVLPELDVRAFGIVPAGYTITRLAA